VASGTGVGLRVLLGVALPVVLLDADGLDAGGLDAVPLLPEASDAGSAALGAQAASKVATSADPRTLAAPGLAMAGQISTSPDGWTSGTTRGNGTAPGAVTV
jgi:hypothetical protein